MLRILPPRRGGPPRQPRRRRRAGRWQPIPGPLAWRAAWLSRRRGRRC